jgi:hypothetical protein
VTRTKVLTFADVRRLTKRRQQPIDWAKEARMWAEETRQFVEMTTGRDV